MPLLLALLFLPILEIALFIVVGRAIGVWLTLLLVIATSAFGLLVLQAQGVLARLRVRQAIATLSDPTGPLAHGALAMLAGILLILPGFFTDLLGLLLLIPPVRTALMRALRGRMVTARSGFGQGGRRGAEIIDGDYYVTPDDTDPPRRSPGAPPMIDYAPPTSGRDDSHQKH
ncbi:MAG: FxsA family protein [Paracoccus sp. (in: a-proteobacteria)]|nr:FxsA family protein [Paracoccus sp. (in: a-proteobacteria)]